MQKLTIEVHSGLSLMHQCAQVSQLRYGYTLSVPSCHSGGSSLPSLQGLPEIFVNKTREQCCKLHTIANIPAFSFAENQVLIFSDLKSQQK